MNKVRAGYYYAGNRQSICAPADDNAEIFVKPGEPTRWYIVNAGPNDYVAFHFIAGMLDVRDGSVRDNYGALDRQDETWTIPPGSASIIEATFPEAGLYVGVDHNLNHVIKGGAFAVIATPDAAENDQPTGTGFRQRLTCTAAQ
jgi:nitrite reductase (NO-forming)